MPLIVTTTIPDTTPTRVVSPDGILTGTADTDHSGVLLRADYSSAWGVVDAFESNVSGWANNSNATVTRTTASPINGNGSLLWTRNLAVSSITRTLPTFPVKPYEQKVVVYFTAKTTATGPGVILSLSWAGTGAGYTEAGLVTSVPRAMFATFYIPANATPTTQLVFNAAPTNNAGTLDSGNVVLDDLTVEIQPPIGVYFSRDGSPVRGASPAPASDGIAYAYDYEGTFGQASIWTTQPVYSIRNAEIIGPSAGGVALVVPDLSDALNMSLKSVNQPDLSRKVIGKWPAATRGWEGRDSMSANPGAGLSSGSWDVPVAQPETWVMETTTQREAAQLEKLLMSGPLLVQHAQTHRRPDMFAVVKTVSVDYKLGPVFPELLWTVAFLPIDQPTPVGASPLIPSRSYADLAESFDTYANTAGSLTDYDAWLTPVTVLAGTGFGVDRFGTVPYGT